MAKQAGNATIEGHAAGAWAHPGWRKAALEYHASRGANTFAVTLPTADIERLGRLLHEHVSIEAACRDDARRHPTPQVTVEAVALAVRARGRSALQEPATKGRISRCDETAKAQLRERIKKFESAGVLEAGR
jgi:hypothetical protein